MRCGSAGERIHIGPLLALGPIATTLAGAGVGGVTDGVVGALVGFGIPEEHAKVYAENIDKGSILVSVECGNRCDEARSTMTRYAGFEVRDYAGLPAKGVERHWDDRFEGRETGTIRREDEPNTRES